MYFLLDLNFTLVGNSPSINTPNRMARIRAERYRIWLIDMLQACQPEGILLVTIRPEREREATLRHIAILCDGWQPDDCFFSTLNVAPAVWKEYACKKLIFPKYGSDPKGYIAAESNPSTQAMYARLGIKGFKVFPSLEDEPEESKNGDEPSTGTLF